MPQAKAITQCANTRKCSQLTKQVGHNFDWEKWRRFQMQKMVN